MRGKLPRGGWRHSLGRIACSQSIGWVGGRTFSHMNNSNAGALADEDGCSDSFVVRVSSDQQRARTCSLHTTAHWMPMSAKRWLLKHGYEFANVAPDAFVRCCAKRNLCGSRPVGGSADPSSRNARRRVRSGTAGRTLRLRSGQAASVPTRTMGVPAPKCSGNSAARFCRHGPGV